MPTPDDLLRAFNALRPQQRKELLALTPKRQAQIHADRDENQRKIALRAAKQAAKRAAKGASK